MNIHDFYLEWRAASNPWKECWRETWRNAKLDGSDAASVSATVGVFLRPFLPYLVLFVVLNELGKRLGRRYGGPLSSRPTFLAGLFNSAATSALSLYLLVVPSGEGRGSEGEGEDLSHWYLWQTVAIPLSLAYFAVDCIYYCLPRGDWLIFVHHVVIAFCHYPALNRSGAAMAGCGDAGWVFWISAIGYSGEASTVLMNYRWYLIQTLEGDWWGFGFNNVLVVLSWAARVVLYPYLLAVEILPRAGLWMEHRQIMTLLTWVLGHSIIGLLSLYWLLILLKGGVKPLLTFQKSSKKKDSSSGGFSFGDDIGRGREVRKGKDATNRSIGRWILIQQKARGWVEGTLFDPKQPLKREHGKAA